MCSVSTNSERASPTQQGFQRLALRLSVNRYPQLLHIDTHVNSYMLMILFKINKLILIKHYYFKSPYNPAADL